MEQFIGYDAHKKFSVFVAVKEKGQAGEALRVQFSKSGLRARSCLLLVHPGVEQLSHAI